ncbi:MAG: glycerol-3-phosphate acyltransferase [Chloroflexi bacterium]|nr:glycerol-3-phosphate acyltransferase [Chloroflexota bacterium]
MLRDIWITAVIAIVTYFEAAIPVGALVARVLRGKGFHLRRFGTGNIGADNVAAAVGILPALFVGLATVFQGYTPVAVGRLLGLPDIAAICIGLIAIWRYRGRAMAISFGTLLPFALYELIWLGIPILVGRVIREFAISLLLVFMVLPLFLYFRGRSMALVAYAGVVFLYIVYRRMEGVKTDIAGKKGKERRRILLDRLLHDRRPRRLGDGSPSVRQSTISKTSPGERS